MSMRRARRIGLETWETETQMNALNESLARDAERQRLAVELARENYGSDDVEIAPGAFLLTDRDADVESVDGGYWVEARVWVEADDVEERM